MSDYQPIRRLGENEPPHTSRALQEYEFSTNIVGDEYGLQLHLNQMDGAGWNLFRLCYCPEGWLSVHRRRNYDSITTTTTT